MTFALRVLTTAFISLLVIIAFYKWFPLSWIEPERGFGSTITTIAAGDTLSASRSTINENFRQLNITKLENGTTTASLFIGSTTLC